MQRSERRFGEGDGYIFKAILRAGRIPGPKTFGTHTLFTVIYAKSRTDKYQARGRGYTFVQLLPHHVRGVSIPRSALRQFKSCVICFLATVMQLLIHSQKDIFGDWISKFGYIQYRLEGPNEWDKKTFSHFNTQNSSSQFMA